MHFKEPTSYNSTLSAVTIESYDALLTGFALWINMGTIQNFKEPTLITCAIEI